MFKPGDRVRKKNGEMFSNGEYVVTVDCEEPKSPFLSNTDVWLRETGTFISSEYIELAYNEGYKGFKVGDNVLVHGNQREIVFASGRYHFQHPNGFTTTGLGYRTLQDLINDFSNIEHFKEPTRSSIVKSVEVHSTEAKYNEYISDGWKYVSDVYGYEFEFTIHFTFGGSMRSTMYVPKGEVNLNGFEEFVKNLFATEEVK